MIIEAIELSIDPLRGRQPTDRESQRDRKRCVIRRSTLKNTADRQRYKQRMLSFLTFTVRISRPAEQWETNELSKDPLRRTQPTDRETQRDSRPTERQGTSWNECVYSTLKGAQPTDRETLIDTKYSSTVGKYTATGRDTQRRDRKH